MQLETPEECGTYVEAELRRLGQSQPGWHASRSSDMPERLLTWSIRRGTGEGWYTLEARMVEHEFLIWLGNHQVGEAGLHWIMRPAVHVAFSDLWPRNDPIALRYSLADVLGHMISTLALPGQLVTRFDLNSYSHT
jgi:hypothetical protein